jgi:hypothetical protein
MMDVAEVAESESDDLAKVGQLIARLADNSSDPLVLHVYGPNRRKAEAEWTVYQAALRGDLAKGSGPTLRQALEVLLTDLR